MITYLKMQKNRLVGDVQEDFNNAFPFLKIEFYKTNGRQGPGINVHLNKLMSLERAGISREGTLRITDTMTVGELEGIFNDQYGTNVQVCRKSGSIWLETTMTDKWTLGQQNEHGKELSTPERTTPDNNEIDYT